MPLKIVYPDHLELMGEGFVLLTAPHAVEASLYMGQIVEDAALVARAYAVLGKTGREYADAARAQAVQAALHKAISAMMADNDIRCVLDVQGRTENGVDIGTGNGLAASESLTELVRGHLSHMFKTTVNVEDAGPKPGSVIATHYAKEKDGTFAVDAIQIQFGHEERHNQRDKVVSAIAELVALVNGSLKPTDPPRPAAHS